MSAAICNAIVRIRREYLGRGPTKARASLHGDDPTWRREVLVLEPDGSDGGEEPAKDPGDERAAMTGSSYDAPLERFRTEFEPHRGTLVLCAHGEIDIDTADELAGQLRDLLERGFDRVVLDLRGVSFIDSSGLHAILAASAAGDRAGVDFRIVSGPPPVQRLFELTNTASALRFIDVREIDVPER